MSVPNVLLGCAIVRSQQNGIVLDDRDLPVPIEA